MNYDSNGSLMQTHIPGLKPPKRGKVRDIYDLGDSLLLVATDRISAFDVIMPNGIPDKGKILTGLTAFWLSLFKDVPNHLITMNPDLYPQSLAPFRNELAGRSMLVKKAKPLPVECVARGYIIGSGWKDYQKTGMICGIILRPGYRLAEKFDVPIFTPATKAEMGEHDENISYAQMINLIGAVDAAWVREKTLKLYTTAADYARQRGIIIADTKFEFGHLDGEVILIDEVLTPDSSRFWPAEQHLEGVNPASLDKQFVRDYLEDLHWNKQPPAPELPNEIVNNTRQKYFEAYQTITGKKYKL
jgi:phosphoribosylaminoimidazole-succinocarboxamide synthase